MQKLNIRSDLVDPLTWGLSTVTQIVIFSDIFVVNKKKYWIHIHFLKIIGEKIAFLLSYCGS